MKKSFKFSIIMAVYNVEDYIEEAIESVVNQDVGFEDNIQLILINDGSPDNSHEICELYKKKFPENVVYYKQKNGGVSSARNKGLDFAKGELINFCDPDDILDSNVCSKVLNSLKKYSNNCSLVSLRVKFFGAREGFHPLDYKFNVTKYVDLNYDYDFIQLSSSSVFIKSKLIGDLRFDERVKYGEDSNLLNRILIKNPNYIVLSDAIYNYRKRESETSALDMSVNDVSWYINSLKYYLKDLLKYSIDVHGMVLPFIQFLVAYDLQFRLKSEVTAGVLSVKEFEEYELLVKDLLLSIDDNIFLAQKSMFIEHKVYAMKLKYGSDLKFKILKNKLLLNNIVAYDFSKKRVSTLNILNVDNGCLEITGEYNNFLGDDIDLFFLDQSGKKYNVTFICDVDDPVISGYNEKILVKKIFKVKIPLDKIKKVTFNLSLNKSVTLLKMNFEKFAKLTNLNIRNYYFSKGYFISYSKNTISVKKDVTKLFLLKSEILYLLSLLKRNHYKVFYFKICFLINNIFSSRELWLVSDRELSANDNGLALFKYLNDKNVKCRARVYFVLSKSSYDYKSVKKIGKVINNGSLKHQLYSVLADKIISSHGEDNIFYPYSIRDAKLLNSILKFKFVFLQHGIIKDDLSLWLRITLKNLSVFVTSVSDEYKSVLDCNYGYTDDVVKLTGLPRYDLLENNPKNIISIMPTWRKKIVDVAENFTNISLFNEYIESSEYHIFYTTLLSDPNLVKILRERNFVVNFYVHPSMNHLENSIFSEFDDVININHGNTNYAKVFSESSILISDYSSVAFDFAYLKKPVVYTQFENKNFYEGQIYSKGYFDYEKNGLGPVCDNVEDTVNNIVNIINNDCLMDSKYLKRVNNFYKYFDKNNSERVLKEIEKL